MASVMSGFSSSLTVSPQLKSSRVLVIGDSCDDLYYFGICHRKNPESPAPLLSVQRTELRGGMALNVAANLMSLGLNVDVVTNVDRPKKERFFDSSHSCQLLRVDTDVRVERVKDETLRALDLSQYAAIVISDYDKGFMSAVELQTIVERATCHVFIDTKKTSLGGLDHPHVTIKINETERRLLVEPKVFKHARLIVTLGGAGAELEDRLFPGYNCPVFDVCGAGDSFLAGLVFSYLSCGDFPRSIDFANRCAAISVQHVGTYAVKHSDLA